MDKLGEKLQEAAAQIAQKVEELSRGGDRLLICIDGRCASGKTTLAALLGEKLGANVVHADDFYLQPQQQTADRYAEPGGNMDRERLFEEVIRPWQQTGSFCYRPYDAHEDRFEDPLCFPPRDVTIVEGSYSSHPDLWDAYNLHVFVTTDREHQIERIRKRNGESGVVEFSEQWIPLEERYFSKAGLEQRSEICIRT